MAIERVSSLNLHPVVWGDHVHRYSFAKKYCRGTVLDVACGIGYGSEFILKNPLVHRYYGVDISSEPLLTFNQKFRTPIASVIQGNCYNLPFSSASFETIVSFETIEHLEDPFALISEIARVIKSDGIFIGSVPSRQQEEIIDRLYGKNPFHKTRFDREAIEKVISTHFAYIQFFEQSCEVVDFIRPSDNETISQLNFTPNPQKTDFSPGPILFVASNLPVNIPHSQISLLLNDSFYNIDEAHKNYVDQYVALNQRLNESNQQLQSENQRLEDLLVQERERVGQLTMELDRIYNSRSYRLIEKLKQYRLHKVLLAVYVPVRPFVTLFKKAKAQTLYRLSRIYAERMAVNVPTGFLRIIQSNEKNLSSNGNEVWLLDVLYEPSAPAKGLSNVKHSQNWEQRVNVATRSGYVLYSNKQGTIDVPIDQLKGLAFQSHAWSGVITIIYHEKKFHIDLYNEKSGVVYIDLKTGEVNSFPSIEYLYQSNSVALATENRISTLRDADIFSDEEKTWINRIKQSGKPVAAIHPEWMGIRSSTEQLFDEIIGIPDTLTESSAEHYAKLLIEADCPALVIQGFPLTYEYLIKALNRLKPDLPIYVIWHGGFIQSDEDYNWMGFKKIGHLVGKGYIKKWGFVKKGMAEIMAAKGFPTGFVMNYVRTIPEKASVLHSNSPRIAVWASWRKKPFVSLAATSMIKNAQVDVYGYNSDRLGEYNRVMQISPRIEPEFIPHDEVLKRLPLYDLNLYISFYECTPMLPLESLSVGAPCLFGPTSHLFEDDPYLYSRLVVPYPDRAEVIAQYCARAIEEREKIVEAYKKYAVQYNARAREILREFLDGLEA